jgi:hypothetical protein
MTFRRQDFVYVIWCNQTRYQQQDYKYKRSQSRITLLTEELEGLVVRLVIVQNSIQNLVPTTDCDKGSHVDLSSQLLLRNAADNGDFWLNIPTGNEN